MELKKSKILLIDSRIYNEDLLFGTNLFLGLLKYFSLNFFVEFYSFKKYSFVPEDININNIIFYHISETKKRFNIIGLIKNKFNIKEHRKKELINFLIFDIILKKDKEYNIIFPIEPYINIPNELFSFLNKRVKKNLFSIKNNLKIKYLINTSYKFNDSINNTIGIFVETIDDNIIQELINFIDIILSTKKAIFFLLYRKITGKIKKNKLLKYVELIELNKFIKSPEKYINKINFFIFFDIKKELILLPLEILNRNKLFFIKRDNWIFSEAIMNNLKDKNNEYLIIEDNNFFYNTSKTILNLIGKNNSFNYVVEFEKNNYNNIYI